MLKKIIGILLLYTMSGAGKLSSEERLSSINFKKMTKDKLELFMRLHNVSEHDMRMLTTIASIESNFKIDARGSVGEVGLWQLHPQFFKLKNKSLTEQFRVAYRHFSLLKEQCPKLEVLAWNLGCARSKQIKFPNKFVYVKKYVSSYNNLYAKM